MPLIRTRAPDLQKKFKDLLLNVRSYSIKLSKHKAHFFILSATIIYLVLAPNIYANYFVKYGKPKKFNGELPLASDDIKFFFDKFDSLIIDGQKVYLFSGWAFLTNEQDQSKYEKYLLLNSDSRIYLFSFDSVKRPDVQAVYQDLGINVLQSGFNALISGDCLRSGTYNVGLLFWNKADNTAFYSVSNLYLVRTPNHVKVTKGEETEANAILRIFQRLKKYFHDRFEIGINQSFPVSANWVQQSADGMCQRSIGENQFAGITGGVLVGGVIDRNRIEKYSNQELVQNHFTWPTINVVSTCDRKEYLYFLFWAFGSEDLRLT